MAPDANEMKFVLALAGQTFYICYGFSTIRTEGHP